MQIETFSADETRQAGIEIGKNVAPGTVITLLGDLGVGKTVFAQGLAEGLGITEWINSPTFTIVQIYESGRLPFYHFDVYRIEDPDEMYEIGFEDYFYGDGVCLIEWADLIRDLIPERHMQITIRKNPANGYEYRDIEITQMGES